MTTAKKKPTAPKKKKKQKDFTISPTHPLVQSWIKKNVASETSVHRACAVCNMLIRNRTPEDIQERLLQHYPRRMPIKHIYAVAKHFGNEIERLHKRRQAHLKLLTDKHNANKSPKFSAAQKKSVSKKHKKLVDKKRDEVQWKKIGPDGVPIVKPKKYMAVKRPELSEMLDHLSVMTRKQLQKLLTDEDLPVQIYMHALLLLHASDPEIKDSYKSQMMKIVHDRRHGPLQTRLANGDGSNIVDPRDPFGALIDAKKAKL